MTTRKIRLAGGAQGFNWLPVFIADEQGLFAKNNLEIEYLRVGSVDKATTAVLEGTADLAITPPEGAITNFLAGGPLRIIAANSERLPMSLVAQSGIDSLEALRGKRLGTSSLKEGTAIYTQIMLEQAGLRYPDDYEFVLAGIHTARWDALKNNEIDAAPQPAPWNFLAERDGFSVLGEVADVIPEIIFAALIGNQDWLTDNAEVARDIVAAMAEAHAFVNDPANDNESVKVYQRITMPDDAELARRGFEYTRDLGMWPTALRPTPAALTASIDVMHQAGLITDEQVGVAQGTLDPSYTE